MPIETIVIEQEIRKFLTEEFLSGNDEILNEDVPLMGNVIDSQGVINLVAFLQQRFDVEVGDDEVASSNFDSLKTVVAYVEAKLRSKG
jgi:acyl carrier protein